MSTHRITLNEQQLEHVRRVVMKDVVVSLRNAADYVENVAITSPWPIDRGASSDAQTAMEVLRQDLATLEAVGWPEDETRFSVAS